MKRSGVSALLCRPYSAILSPCLNFKHFSPESELNCCSEVLNSWLSESKVAASHPAYLTAKLND